MIEKHINDKPKTTLDNHKAIAERHEKIKKLESRIDNLIKMRADGEILKEIYFSKKEEAEKEMQTYLLLQIPTLLLRDIGCNKL